MDKFMAYNQENDDDPLDVLAYLTRISQDVNTPEDVETATKLVYNIFSTLYGSDEHLFLSKLQEILRETVDYGCVNVLGHKLQILDKWLFQVVVLSSVSNVKFLLAKPEHQEVFREIVADILDNIVITNALSVNLLKTLDSILKKRDDILTSELSTAILYTVHNLALSPFTNIKYYAQNISKNIVKTLSPTQKTYMCSADFLPIRGIETLNLLKISNEEKLRKETAVLMKIVNRLFMNNVDSKEGGFIYMAIAQIHSFDEWKEVVWIWFRECFSNVEFEREYFHSLLKYWIPISVKQYKAQLYAFLRTENINHQLKAFILLETTKRNYDKQDLYFSDTVKFLDNSNTSVLGLKILCTFTRKKFLNDIELQSVLKVVYGNSSEVLDDEIVNSLRYFFAQFFITAHILLKHQNSLENYTKFIVEILKFCRINLHKGNCEVAAQILKIMWFSAISRTTQLKILYQVDAENLYETGENLFFNHLQAKRIWDKNDWINDIQACYLNSNGSSANLIQFISEYFLEEIQILQPDEVLKQNQQACLQTADKIKIYSVLLFNKTSKQSALLVDLKLKQLLTSLNSNINEQILFECVLYLELLDNGSKFLDDGTLKSTVEKCVDIIRKILDHDDFDPRAKTGGKFSKIFEAFINSTLSLIMQQNLKSEVILCLLCKIIQHSNMKKPVSLSIEVLKHIWQSSESDLRIKFLDKTLKSICDSSNKLNKIRRSPESRLVIHSICSSETHPQAPLLNWTLQFLLSVISDEDSSEAAVASALHSLEILISDTKLQNFTLRHVPVVTERCVELFRRKSWSIRNADLQLAKSIIERFLGVSLGHYNRPKSLENLLTIFPQIAPVFHRTLCTSPLNESAVIVFQFFSESQTKPSIFSDKFLVTTKNCFLELFVDIIKNYAGNYGTMAVMSYISLCSHREIPEIFCDIVEYLQGNCLDLRKNILGNFMYLLQELYAKYARSFECSSLIEDKLNSLMLVLSSLKENSELFDLLLIKLQLRNSFKLNNLSLDDYKHRIWLHNNIPFVVINSKPSKLAAVLGELYSHQLLSCIEVKILAILTNRLKNNLDKADVSDILNILITKAAITSNKYLLSCYFKVILIFYQKCQEILVEPQIELCGDFYKTMIYVLVLANRELVPPEDFFKFALEEYTKFIFVSEETAYDISTTLQYLYKLSSVSQRATVLKLAFYLLLHQPNTKLEVFNFITNLSHKSISNTLSAFNLLLNHEFLCESLQDIKIVVRFLSELYCYTKGLADGFEDSGTYYLVKCDISVSKCHILKMITRSLLICSKIIL